MQTSISVVISAAGVGSRMGLDIPKSLIQIRGCSLIERQLGLLDKLVELIVVVGFRAEQVAREVWGTRPDAIIVLNHRYQTTGTASSLSLGAKVSSERLVGLDGDVLLSKASIDGFLNSHENLLGIMPLSSNNPHKVKIEKGFVTEFDTPEVSEWEWTGPINITKFECQDIGDRHVYQGVVNLLPMKAMKVDGIELDYQDDIMRCEEWLDGQNGIA
jgi:choline kinase